MRINDIIIKPVLTEKATDLARSNRYAFEVHTQATKTQVKQAVEQLYQVKVGVVRVVMRKGKARRVGRKMMTKKLSDRKIAYITVTTGKIDLFPQT